jgi:glycosyltransferase involved in cell wall biosynthesis
MASFWVRAGRSVRLVTLAAAGADFYPLDPRVERVGLDLLRPSQGPLSAAAANVVRALRVRAALLAGRPDAVVSFGDSSNCLVLLALLGTGVPVIASERSDPRRLPLARSWGLLRRRLYPRARAVAVQTEQVAAWVRSFVPAGRVHVIHNFVAEPKARAALGSRAGPARQVVALGRLSPEKGFDLLLDAFARCAGRHPEWSLSIAGEGPSRAELEAIASRAGIAGRVRFLGVVRDVEELYLRSDLFALSSRYEGFPNALLEAMAAGLPCLAFDCDSGPRDILRDGEDGILVPPQDAAAMAAAMDRLMGDERERLRLGRTAAAVVQRFGLPGVMAAWDRLLDREPRA